MPFFFHIYHISQDFNILVLKYCLRSQRISGHLGSFQIFLPSILVTMSQDLCSCQSRSFITKMTEILVFETLDGAVKAYVNSTRQLWFTYSKIEGPLATYVPCSSCTNACDFLKSKPRITCANPCYTAFAQLTGPCTSQASTCSTEAQTCSTCLQSTELVCLACLYVQVLMGKPRHKQPHLQYECFLHSPTCSLTTFRFDSPENWLVANF